jgi:hypothetical protein
VPDSWGRPTFNDGMQIAVGINYLQNSKAKRESFDWQTARMKKEAEYMDEDRNQKKRVALIAVEQKNNPTGYYAGDYDPVDVLAAQRLLLNETIDEQKVKNEKRRGDIQEFTLEAQKRAQTEQKIDGLIDTWNGLYASGKEAAYTELGKEIYNEILGTGNYALNVDGNTATVENHDGSTGKINFTPQEFKAFLDGHKNKSLEERVKESLTVSEYFKQSNSEAIGQTAKQMYNPETKQTAWVIPPNTIHDPKTGRSNQEAIFFDNPVTQKQIPMNDVAGFEVVEERDGKLVKIGDALEVFKATKQRVDDMGQPIPQTPEEKELNKTYGALLLGAVPSVTKNDETTSAKPEPGTPGALVTGLLEQGKNTEGQGLTPTKKSAAKSFKIDKETGGIVSQEKPEASEKAEKTKKFDPEGSGYDYESAKKAGLKPDSTGHWPSRDPKTGLLLKGKNHKTWAKTIKEEEKKGYEVYKKSDGRYYSRKKVDKWERYAEDRNKVPKGHGIPDSLLQDLPRQGPGGLKPTKRYQGRF